MSEEQTPLTEPSEMEPQITIGVMTPEGFPAQITFSSATVAGLTAKTRKMIEILTDNEWKADSGGSTAAPPGRPHTDGIPPDCPTFGGIPCSGIIDATGKPKWVYSDDGRVAHLRLYNAGDWGYTIYTGTEEGKKKFEEVIKFKAADPIPEVKWPDE